MMKSKKARSVHPHWWVVEPLEGNPTFAHRAMFGCRAIYYDGKMVLVLADREPPWNGLLVPTEREFQESLTADIPALIPHPVLPKWLWLSDESTGFESRAAELVERIRSLDPRIGILPKEKKPRTGI